MAKSLKGYCAVEPNTKISEEVEAGSPLFRELMDHFYSNRGLAKDVFWRTYNSDFINDFSSILDRHEGYSDFTFKSLWKHTDLIHWTPAKNIITNLENRFGGRRNGEAIAYKKYEDAVPKMNAFNEHPLYSDVYIAKVELRTDLKYGLVIYPKTKRLAQEVSKINYNYTLNQKLRDFWASKGVGIGALTEYEKQLGINGVADLDLAQAVGNGTLEIIRIAEGEVGETVLPEESVHLMVAATKHLPLTQRLLKTRTGL